MKQDLRNIEDVEKLEHLPCLLQILAHRSGQLTNFTHIGGQVQLNDKTAHKYVGIFEQLLLVRRVTPWFHRQIKRLVKTPRLHFIDSGLLSATMALKEAQIAKDRTRFDALLETFVFSEVTKQIGWSDDGYTIHYYGTKIRDEVDVVFEADQGAVAAIEVKASAMVHATDFKGIKKLLDYCRDNFKLGVVLYDGPRIVPFGDRLFAAPISCVWN